MKTKLLTICLLLFTSQVFAEEIYLKCFVEGNTHFYKYEESLIGTPKIKYRMDGKWNTWCTERTEYTEYDGKKNPIFQDCEKKRHVKKSKEYGECTHNFKSLSGTGCLYKQIKVKVDFVTREVNYISKYNTAGVKEKEKFQCTRINN